MFNNSSQSIYVSNFKFDWLMKRKHGFGHSPPYSIQIWNDDNLFRRETRNSHVDNEIKRIFEDTSEDSLRYALLYRMGRIAPDQCFCKWASTIAASFTYDELWEWIRTVPELSIYCMDPNHNVISPELVIALDKFRFFRQFTRYGYLYTDEEIATCFDECRENSYPLNVVYDCMIMLVRSKANEIVKIHPYHRGILAELTADTLRKILPQQPQVWLNILGSVRYKPEVLKLVIDDDPDFFEKYRINPPSTYVIISRLAERSELIIFAWQGRVPRLNYLHEYNHNHFWYISNFQAEYEGQKDTITQTEYLVALEHITMDPNAPRKPMSLADILPFWPECFLAIENLTREPWSVLRAYWKRWPAQLFPFGMGDDFCDVLIRTQENSNQSCLEDSNSSCVKRKHFRPVFGTTKRQNCSELKDGFP